MARTAHLRAALGAVLVSVCLSPVALPASSVLAQDRSAGPTATTARPVIVFARADESTGDDDLEIWTMGRWGGSQRRLTFNDGLDDREPAWSPSGQIAYVHFRTFFDTELWVMDADGSDKHLVLEGHGELRHPTWSPDGSRLAVAVTPQAGARSQIAVVDADGTGFTTISPPTADDSFPDWSPDGTAIAFVSRHRVGDGTRRDVFAMAPDGSARRQLSHVVTPLGALDPAWDPSGRRIVYSDEDFESADTWIVRIDGSGARLVLRDAGWATWSPYGTFLVLVGPCPDGQVCPGGLVRSDLSGTRIRPQSLRPGLMFDTDPDFRAPASSEG